MKVMAIGTIVQPVTPELRSAIMPNEVPATLQLYLDGKIEQYCSLRSVCCCSPGKRDHEGVVRI